MVLSVGGCSWLKEIGRAEQHENVAARLYTIDDSDLSISVSSAREIAKGIKKASDPRCRERDRQGFRRHLRRL